MTIPRWNTLTARLEEYTYARELLTRPEGPPTNASVDMINGDLLLPYINTVQNRQAFLINCYGLSDRGEEQPFAEITDLNARYQLIAETMDASALGEAPDDVVVYGEDDTDLWMFWMHRSGRCEVVRLPKSVSLDAFIEAHINYLREAYADGWRYNTESDVAIIHRLQGELETVSWV